MEPSGAFSELAAAAPENIYPLSERKPGLQLRPMFAAGARATPALLSSVHCPGQAQSDFIQPEIALSYERHAVDSKSGLFSARISLRNKALHIAHQPFLCLPILGLDLSPAPGWSMRDVSSIRRLRRFGQEGSQLLDAGSGVHCCTISLLFSADDGGRIEYESGNWHAVKTLPDLRLTCVAGAGNFPSERLPLVISAMAIKTFLTSLITAGRVPNGLVEFADPPNAEDAPAPSQTV
jgi:hypothetical protein